MAELNYQFRQRMLEVHKKNRRVEKPLGSGQIEITSEWRIVVPEGNDFLIRAGRDLEDYFFTSMNVEVNLTVKATEAKSITYSVDPSLENDGSYRIVVAEDSICLIGKDERAAAQAGYFLEDLMNLEESPFLQIGTRERAPRFRTRMVHSGFSLDIFPDEHLRMIAHHGINTILLFTRGVNHTSYGYTDFNDIIHRASLYGIDTYAYSYMISEKHPEDEGAEEFYESLYGNLLDKHPGLKGVVFVGESVGFPSHDERTTMRLKRDNRDENGNRIIKDKPDPGWFPCRDYPQWVDMVKRIIRKRNPDIDIVFWTYNWGKCDRDIRIELIDNLPTDISLQATFEMFENLKREGVQARTSDYTLFFEGPGQYFLSEAEAAKRRGIPLYSMTNTGGLTWDVGTVPFEPTPYQWLKRFDAVVDANEKYGLCGLMESHHYGFYPSFISELAKWSFWLPREDGEKMIDLIIARDWGKENLDDVRTAYKMFSDGIRKLTTTNEDQYGPMRIGPSYPLVLFRDAKIVIPFGLNAMHGSNRICRPDYCYPIDRPGMREKLEGETRLYSEGAGLFLGGAEILNAVWKKLPENKRDEARRIAGIGEFMGRAALTTHHAKAWYALKNSLISASADEYPEILAKLSAIGKAELENAHLTLPLVDFDSRLGYEPSMDYMAHREAIEWKIGVVERVLSEDIPLLMKERKIEYIDKWDLPHSTFG